MEVHPIILDIPIVEHILVMDGILDRDWEKASVGKGDFGEENGVRGYDTGRFAYRSGFRIDWMKSAEKAVVMRRQFVDTLETYKAVSKEIRDCGKVIHIGNPGLLKLLAAYDEPLKYVFVFESCSEPIKERMIRQRSLVPIERVCVIIWQVTNAIKFLHKYGVACNKLNLSNVLLKHCTAWTPIRLHQISKVCEPNDQKDNILAFKEDNFRIGLIMHLMLTGRDPFDTAKHRCPHCVIVQLRDSGRPMILRCEHCLKGMMQGYYRRLLSTDVPQVARNLMENIMLGDSRDWLGPEEILVHPFFALMNEQTDQTS